MQTDVRQQGATGQSLAVFFKDNTTFLGKTGLAFDSAGISLKYARTLAAATTITPADLATLATAFSSGGFKEIGQGWYRLDIPNAALAVGVGQVVVSGSVTGAEMEPVAITLTLYAPLAAGITVDDITAAIDANSTDLDAIGVVVTDIAARLPAALVGGRIDASVGAIAAATITATAIATDAITAAKIATDAITAAKIATGAITNAKVADGLLSAAKFATDSIAAAAIKADAVTKIQLGLAAASDMVTVLANLATLLASNAIYVKNTAVAVFPFPMKLTDGTPGTGLTVTGTISKDGGAFAGIAGAITEISAGWYSVALTQTEMNANEIALVFTAPGAAQRDIKIKTQS
jgi:hypothetical protein